MYFECTGGSTKGSLNREYTYGRFVNEERGHGKYEWVDLSTLKCDIKPIDEVMKNRRFDHMNRQVKWAAKKGYIKPEEALGALLKLMGGDDIYDIIEAFMSARGEHSPTWDRIYRGEPNCAFLPECERTYIKGRTWTI